MSQILLDLGRTQNQINLTQAKYRAAIEENRTARTARQVAQGMKDGFDFAKVEGIAMNELLEKRAKSQAEEAAEEAAKWAQEQLEKKASEEESKKKDSDVDGEGRQTADNSTSGEVGYTQNAEQNQSTLWNKLQQAKN